MYETCRAQRNYESEMQHTVQQQKAMHDEPLVAEQPPVSCATARRNRQANMTDGQTHRQTIGCRDHCLKHTNFFVFFHSGVCEKRFPFIMRRVHVLQPLPLLFNVEEVAVRWRSRRKGIFFRRRHHTPTVAPSTLMRRGRGSTAFRVRCKREPFFADTGMKKQARGCARL